jgi:hypothetical protein
MQFDCFRLVAGLAVMVTIVGVTSASATTTLQMSLEYLRSYTAYGSSEEETGYSLADGVSVAAGMVDPTDIHEFNIYFELTDVYNTPNAEDSLGGLIVDVVLGDGLTGWGYCPLFASPMYDPPPSGVGGGPLRPLYTTNAGTDEYDLTRIELFTDGLAAHALDPGENGPTLMGSVYVIWDGVTPTSLNVQAAAAAPSAPWGLWVGGWIDTTSPYTHSTGTLTPMGPDTMFGSVNPNGPTAGFDLVAGVPEPASIVLVVGLAVIGHAALVRRRR